ncbi:U3 small nucleolar RNA-associated protein 20 [Phlyctema vagabunda]|uniref:U3 small nucleolar RNA-associated protein 20 n=1 Tax=Phlyctema vagabunda TaxID=108571 RepID=A0ABR4P7K2_9HELO
MPATSSGRIVKTRKTKSGTAHQKNHRWESFTSKISKLNSLDPIRKVRRHDIDTEDLAATTSYFKAGLEKWQELNMSEGFSLFMQEVNPLCDSLPQILHFEGKIMELLVTYIEKKERESLEPLLELMTDFAHDLGSRFEKYYAKALELVTSIAATPQDVEVIEWSFTCLAFMFKYLSKLLVPDLRPTYDLMAPLLGKHRQQPHIARFAAEAMSFLVKKAGAPANRDKALPTIIQYAKSDLQSIAGTRPFVLYYHGLMTLFAEAMKGNGLTVHTSGPAIMKALYLCVEEGDFRAVNGSRWSDVVCGVLTSMVHHTSSETLKDVVDVVLEQASAAVEAFSQSCNKLNLSHLILSARMIGVIAGVRKGSRVNNWPALLDVLSQITQVISKNSSLVMGLGGDFDLWRSLVLTISLAMQYSPMDAMIPFISKFMDALSKDPLAKWFLTFCSYLSQAEPERFRSIALPYFRRFVVAHWSDKDNEDTLLILLPKMVSSGVLPSRYAKDGFNLPQSWQDQMVSKFERLELKPFPEQASPAVSDRSPITWHDRCLPKYNALLEVLECSIVHPSTNARIAEILLRKLKLALRPSFALAPEEVHFIVGRGFSAYCRMIKGGGEVDRALEPLLRAAAPRYARLPNFLEALLAYESSLQSLPPPVSIIKSDKALNDEEEVDLLLPSLVSNLSTESHDLRILSLQLLDLIYNTKDGATSKVMNIMLLVEQTPLDLQTARSASMHIRNLATLYPQQASDSYLRQAIPSFCFGMLTVKFAQIWDDASAALKQISEVKEGEEIVAELVFRWLETPSVPWDGSAKNMDQASSSGLTDFECSNLLKLVDLADDAEAEVINAQGTMLNRFEDAQSLVASPPAASRAQALRVLSTAPHIAQKRSRQFIPMFLSWAGQNDENEEPVLSDWTRKDQKAQLDLLALFTNPKVLYKSEEIYEALLKLISNGDIEIQRSALKAIFTWKNSNIRPYEENLLNLLDEARFKDEVAIMLQGDTLVQFDHRPQLMPVLLRLLYGRTISRKGAASGRQGMEARRLTVLRNLSVEDVGGFLDVSLGELKNVRLFIGSQLQESVLLTQGFTLRRQVGFMNMIEGVLKELGTKVIPYTEKLLVAVLYCLILATRELATDSDESDGDDNVTQTSLLRVVRQTGLKCLNLLFKNALDFDWSSYLNAILHEVIQPRLENLPIETAQGISGVLQLFFTWSASPKMVLYLGAEEKVIPKIAECLVPAKSKNEVKLFVLTIIKNMVKFAKDADSEPLLAKKVKSELLAINMDHILTQISGVLRGHQDLSKDLLEACVETVSDLAPFVTTSTQGRNLVDIAVFLLDQPSRRVNPKTKGGLLLVLEHFVPLYNLQNDSELKDRVYNTITSLFGFFKDKISREVLSRVLLVYSQNDPVIADVAAICLDLNSFLEGRLDEPDYDRRMKAFNVINSPRGIPFTAYQWKPLLYNMLYYIRYEEEHGVLLNNSSDGLCHFIDAAKNSPDSKSLVEQPTKPEMELTTPESTGAASYAATEFTFKGMLLDILVPALYSGAREPSEFIRREYTSVMAHLVKSFPKWQAVNDMHSLLGDDEETSFFNNVLSVGKGRKSSALGLLSAASEKGELGGKNTSHFLVPLVEHLIFDRAEGNDGHNLAAEATITVGNLTKSLEWPQYRALLRRYIGYIQSKPDLEKQIIRLLGKVIDGLALAAQEDGQLRSTLARTMPKQTKLTDDLTTTILPPLVKYIHHKDEAIVSLRVPVAVIIVRLLKLLPEEQLWIQLPAVLTDTCHILRSKAQEARDMARDTLTKICILLGPTCFGFVLKELRGALQRGNQRHVLSYTMHSILVATIPEYAPGDLDYCLKPIVDVIMDDIFGDPGKEKDAEEYTSKMKEVRSSKSHDSMELIARTATLSRLTVLLHPIQLLLKEKLNLRMVRKIDELLNRISRGLLMNSAAQSHDSLQLCYDIIQDVYSGEKPQVKAKEDYRLKKFLIQRGAKKSGDRGSTTVYTYKLVGFAFDVMRSVLKKYDELRKPGSLAQFVPIIGDAVVEAEEEVKVAAFRLLTTIVKVPLRVAPEAPLTGTDLYRVATAEATKSILVSSSTISDLCQASLKLTSVVLHHHQDVIIKDKTIDDILDKLKDDLTEPDRRHITFNFLRAILDCKIQTARVYDTLEHVKEIMVTNSDNDTRKLARGAYLQFLRDYPQTTKRWKKQLEFIKVNLNYEIEDGRWSLLDVILTLLSKSSEEYIQQICEGFFAPLILVHVQDDSERCRQAAGIIIKDIFQRADDTRLTDFLDIMRNMVQSTDDTDRIRLGFKLYRLYYEARDVSEDKDFNMLQGHLVAALETAGQVDSEWRLIFDALEFLVVLCEKFPRQLLASDKTVLWKNIRMCLSYPHAWVKSTAAKLIEIYLADFIRANAGSFENPLPLKGSGGLALDGEDTIELIRRTVGGLRTPGLLVGFGQKIEINLVILARLAEAYDLKWGSSPQIESEDEEEETEIEEKDQKTALQYLFSRLSYILRRETSPPRAPALIPKTTALNIVQNLAASLPGSTLTSVLQAVLLPLNHLTDPSIPIPYSTDEEFKADYTALKDNASEIMQTLQTKVGVQQYTQNLLEVKQAIKARRMQRSSKRKIEAVAAPEKYGRDKKKKVERKKERRKERGQEHRDARQVF